MAEVYAFLADGFELVECLAVVDVLRRGRVDIQTVSITGNRVVTCSHGVPVTADKLWEEIDASDAKMLFLPGGKKGTDNLAASSAVKSMVKSYNEAGRLVCAICAAPSVLGAAGVLDGHEATCFPGFEDRLGKAVHKNLAAITSGNVITGRSMGTAIDFGLAIAEKLVGKETAVKTEENLHR